MLAQLRVSLLLLSVAATLLLHGGCDLDITNPNAPSEEQVLTTTEGVEALAVGMQEYYATTTLESVLLVSGTTSREVAVDNTLANLVNLEDGGPSLPPSNADVLRIWSRNYRVVQMAQELRAATPNLSFPAGTESGLLTLADLFQAMALGNIAQHFEQGPITTNRTEPVSFVSRNELFAEALRLLDRARTRLGDTPPSDDFTNTIRASGLDLRNTINAYRARYHLFAGNAVEAESAAADVDLSSTSTFGHDEESPNPVWNGIVRGENFAPRDAFGFPTTNPDDARLDFFLVPIDTTSTPNEFPVDGIAGFFDTVNAPMPLYVPGEMLLIQAEARVRQNDLPGAESALNAVRTKAPADDPFGIGADLPAYDGPQTAEALLAAIHQERRAELFLQGVALEDMRRLGAEEPDPDDSFARSRNFYPYPQQERQNNPNTPENPDI
jgi:hypothetical protein